MQKTHANFIVLIRFVLCQRPSVPVERKGLTEMMN